MHIINRTTLTQQCHNHRLKKKVYIYTLKSIYNTCDYMITLDLVLFYYLFYVIIYSQSNFNLKFKNTKNIND